MSKIRITMTVVKEFIPDVDAYGGETDVAKMAEVDREGYEDDPGLLIEYADSITVVAEVIE